MDTTPVTEHYSIRVQENIATSGFGLTSYLKYRWTIFDADGSIEQVGYAMTARGAQRMAKRMARALERKLAKSR